MANFNVEWNEETYFAKFCPFYKNKHEEIKQKDIFAKKGNYLALQIIFKKLKGLFDLIIS